MIKVQKATMELMNTPEITSGNSSGLRMTLLFLATKSKRSKIFWKWIRIPSANEMNSTIPAYFRRLCVFIIQRYISLRNTGKKRDETENQGTETTGIRVELLYLFLIERMKRHPDERSFKYTDRKKTARIMVELSFRVFPECQKKTLRQDTPENNQDLTLL